MLNTNPIEPFNFAQHLGGWTGTGGPDGDVAISSRVRLARNLKGFHFRTRIDPDEARRVAESLRAAINAAPIDGDTRWVPIDDVSELTRLLLRERYLCSRDLAPVGEASGSPANLAGRAVVFGVGEDVSIMVNEEDHLRMQAFAAGFNLNAARENATALDRSLEGQLDFAYDQDLGYLTGCPTNVGTGMRASVMLHLPALGLVRDELGKVIHSAQRTGLAVRGIYGEGSRAVGDFYQVSNQVTLGRSEEQLVAELAALVPSIIDFERRVRDKLVETCRAALEQRTGEARESLATSRSVDTNMALTALSTLRLGHALGFELGASLPDFGRLVIQIQKGHVHALAGEQVELGEVLSPTRRDAWRAAFLRRRFGRN